jgi:hypothetical protein
MLWAMTDRWSFKTIVRGVLVAILAVPVVMGASAAPAAAANCAMTTTGLVALPDLAGGQYNSVAGGLYPDGTNTPPAKYAPAGKKTAAAIKPLDRRGQASSHGKIVLLSIGMSNATIEFSMFGNLEQHDPQRGAQLVVVDGAQGGQAALAWAHADAPAWRVAAQRLQSTGTTPAQVQAIWLKQADPRPASDFATYTDTLGRELHDIVTIAARRYPNLRQVFVSPRIYGGYATTPLNPEPYAYWTGYADKALVASSVGKPNHRPWVGWGPYLWTDGTKGRADGLTWTCDEVRPNDGTHPSPTGAHTVATMLQDFFHHSPFTPWFR